jgi:heme exporter protein CcmD
MTKLVDFFAMNGYGYYIWGAYLVSALAIAIEIALVRARYSGSRRAALGAGRER